MKNIFLLLLCLVSFHSFAYTQQSTQNWYVNNHIGNDARNGLLPTLLIPDDGISGPKKSIWGAVAAANNNDIINIVATGVELHFEPNLILISKNLEFRVYGNIIIDLSTAQSGIHLNNDSKVKFTSMGNYVIQFNGSPLTGINIISGEILLDNVMFNIQAPFLFQSPQNNVSTSSIINRFVDLTNGNDNNNGLSEVQSGLNIGPMRSIFQVYKTIDAFDTYSELANDIFNIEACNNSGGAFDSYTDGPVFLQNVTITGKQSSGNNNNKVVFNLLNTDMHFSMDGKTIFNWNQATNQNAFMFLGSQNTGFVFENGCVELNDAPIEIVSPFLIRRTPSYCSGNVNIPLVVYDNRVYHTIAIQGNPNMCWLKENLDVGTMKLGNQDQENDGIIEKYCYSNDENNCTFSGGLYQWAEAVQYLNGAANTFLSPELTGNIQGICPTNWHIPSWGELGDLQSSVENTGQGNALKSVGVGIIDQNGDGRGTNISGFSVLLAGWRNSDYTQNPAIWNQAGVYTFFLSTFQYSNLQSNSKHMNRGNPEIGMVQGTKANGISVRCVQDQWDGQGHFFRIANIPTGIEEISLDKEIPKSYSLLQNYPNPFNPSTTIIYELTQPENVRINIYDSVGRLIRELVNRDDNAGKHSVIWDGKDSNGKLVSSGNYFYQIISGSFIQAKKMIFLK